MSLVQAFLVSRWKDLGMNPEQSGTEPVPSHKLHYLSMLASSQLVQDTVVGE